MGVRGTASSTSSAAATPLPQSGVAIGAHENQGLAARSSEVGGEEIRGREIQGHEIRDHEIRGREIRPHDSRDFGAQQSIMQDKRRPENRGVEQLSRYESRLDFFSRLGRVHPELFKHPGCAGLGVAPGKSRWPSVGSKALDLHQLLQEVMRHGGFTNVVENKLWKVCGLALYLPPSCTSMSAQLRQNYQKYLLDFEELLRGEIGPAGHSGGRSPAVTVKTEAGRNSSTSPSKGLKPQPNFFDFGHFVDDMVLQESGAIAMHYNARAMMPQELLAFPEFGYDCAPEVRCVYLDIRNHILYHWAMDVRRELLLDAHILGPLATKFGNSPECEPWFDPKLITRIFTFLETCGSINTGAFKYSIERPLRVSVPGNLGIGSKRIVVIGAGFAGLAAATQLKHFGHQVIVLEGRGRVGGRAFTDRSFGGAAVDVGAMLITGGVAHPARMLSDQLGQPLHPVNPTCPLYWSDGRKRARVTEEMDQAVEASFLNATERAVEEKVVLLTQDRFSGRVDVEEFRKDPKPQQLQATNGDHSLTTPTATQNRKEIIQNILSPAMLKEFAIIPEVQKRRPLTQLDAGIDAHDPRVPQLHSELSPAVEAASMASTPVETLLERVRSVIEVAGQCSTLAKEDEARVQAALNRFEGSERISEGFQVAKDSIDRATLAVQHANGVLDDVRRMNKSFAPFVPSETSTATEVDSNTTDKVMRKFDVSLQSALDHFLSVRPPTEPDQKALLQWHMANLEYACATSLSNVSNTHWDQDDEYSFQGPHYLLPHGFSTLAYGLANSVRHDIHFGAKVETIKSEVAADGVVVEYEDAAGSKGLIEADAVLVTVPLGVLKRNELRFEPPLPPWKQGAIDRLGFGNLNKVVVEFPEIFWSKEFDVCGRVVTANDEAGTRLVVPGPSESSSSSEFDYDEHRGEFFTFWPLNRCLPDSRPILMFLVAGKAAHNVEKAEPSAVVDSLMLVLRKMFMNQQIPDPVRATVTKWSSDPMARGAYSYVAVGATGEEYDLLAEPVKNKIFFAGEATSREHPATTGGAYLSGIREACKLATRFGREVQVSRIFRDAHTSAHELLANSGNWYGRKEWKRLKPTDAFIENVMHKRENDNEGDAGATSKAGTTPTPRMSRAASAASHATSRTRATSVGMDSSSNATPTLKRMAPSKVDTTTPVRTAPKYGGTRSSSSSSSSSISSGSSISRSKRSYANGGSGTNAFFPAPAGVDTPAGITSVGNSVGAGSTKRGRWSDAGAAKEAAIKSTTLEEAQRIINPKPRVYKQRGRPRRGPPPRVTQMSTAPLLRELSQRKRKLEPTAQSSKIGAEIAALLYSAS